MKKIILIVVIVCTSFALQAQKLKTDTSKVFTNVDQVPEFAGGREKFLSYVNGEIKKSSRKDTTSGSVIVVSTIEKDGTFTNCKAIKSLNPEADSLALNIVRRSPKWQPAIKDGQIVRCKYSVVIRFGNPSPLKVLLNQR